MPRKLTEEQKKSRQAERERERAERDRERAEMEREREMRKIQFCNNYNEKLRDLVNNIINNNNNGKKVIVKIKKPKNDDPENNDPENDDPENDKWFVIVGKLNLKKWDRDLNDHLTEHLKNCKSQQQHQFHYTIEIKNNSEIVTIVIREPYLGGEVQIYYNKNGTRIIQEHIHYNYRTDNSFFSKVNKYIQILPYTAEYDLKTRIQTTDALTSKMNRDVAGVIDSYLVKPFGKGGRSRTRLNRKKSHNKRSTHRRKTRKLRRS